MALKLGEKTPIVDEGMHKCGYVDTKIKHYCENTIKLYKIAIKLFFHDLICLWVCFVDWKTYLWISYFLVKGSISFDKCELSLWAFSLLKVISSRVLFIVGFGELSLFLVFMQMNHFYINQ